MTLFIEVAQIQIADVPLLGNGVWRPVLISRLEIERTLAGNSTVSKTDPSDVAKFVDSLKTANWAVGSALNPPKSPDEAVSAFVAIMRDDTANATHRLRRRVSGQADH